MEELVKYFNNVTRGLNELANDVAKMVSNLEQEEKVKKGELKEEDKRTLSLQSFQPMTRLRADKKEAVEASQNKEITFVTDKLGDIFKD